MLWRGLNRDRVAMPADPDLLTADGPARPLWRRLLPWAGALLSGIMLASLFPPFHSDDAAWLALVPLMMGLRTGGRGRAFRLGFLAGLIFWLASLFWLTRVTWAGWMGLALYCSLYPGFFAVLVRDAFAACGTKRLWSNLALMLVLALAWTGLEYLRSSLATGFSWNLLALSQVGRPALIQLARFGGAYAVSALIVFVNVAVCLTLLRYVDRGGHWQRTPHLELLFAFGLFAAAMLYGFQVLKDDPPPSTTLRVGLVQPNIPQYEKWTEAFTRKIYTSLEDLSGYALQSGRPDLLIWPETALPDDVRYSETSYALVAGLLEEGGTPILVGSMDSEWPDLGPPRFYNSSFLFGADGSLLERYDKQHLVLFGEYVPFHRFLPFLKALTPIESSVTPGERMTVFELPDPPVLFSVLICFEDTVAALAREAVRAGAQFLVNQTNDAWFDPYAGSRQHLAQSVFRAVEHGVPVVRSTNTGVSCIINHQGRITSILQNPEGAVAFKGYLTGQVEVPLAPVATLYTRIGDQPAKGCGLAVLAYGLFLLVQRIRQGRAEP